jgi:hypothetical protein
MGDMEDIAIAYLAVDKNNMFATIQHCVDRSALARSWGIRRLRWRRENRYRRLEIK